MAFALSHWQKVLSLLLLLCVAARADDHASVLVSEIGRANNESLVWGPYRPNVYFGVRPRIPNSLTSGLVWGKVEDLLQAHHDFRHTCEQHQGMSGYGWEEYDGRTGGQHTVYDDDNNIAITTTFVKIPGGKHGGSWAVRVKGTPMGGRDDVKTTIIPYATLQGLGSLEVENKFDQLGCAGDVVINGESDGLGKYKLIITKGTGTHPDDSIHAASYAEAPLDRTRVLSTRQGALALWQQKTVILQSMKEQIDGYVERHGQRAILPAWQIYTIPHRPGAGNFHTVQKVFEGAFEFDVIFASGSAGKQIASEDVTAAIKTTKKSFAERFASTFTPAAPYNDAEHMKFAKSMFSNLLGGIGFFSGDSIVDRSNAVEYEEENEGFWEEAAAARAKTRPTKEGPSQLFTSIPSRPYFARGFLWDEGFHLIPIAEWDIDLTLEIVKSWFNLMDEDGWIAREQILGDEARRKVPPEFQIQYPHYANPPTLFFILRDFIDKLVVASKNDSTGKGAVAESLKTAYLDHPEAGMHFLKTIYPLLKRQYDWFHNTQSGDVNTYERDVASSSEVFRWRGRTPALTLTSGLDDYPRAQPPHPGELHVDLISWVGMMTKALRKIADFIGEDDDAADLAKREKALLKNIEMLHWSEEKQTYCDATIDDFEEHALVCHKGYISLFPFLTGLLEPDSPTLPAMLDLIGDESEIFSPYGLLSLSKKDKFYGTAENYWRGPIWMNINYLAVEQLLRFAQTPGPQQKHAAQLYTQLRRNLVDTVFNSWKQTGFAWEQYHPDTGAGQRTQHFTGWTSLIVKIMAMPDVPVTKGHDEL